MPAPGATPHGNPLQFFLSIVPMTMFKPALKYLYFPQPNPLTRARETSNPFLLCPKSHLYTGDTGIVVILSQPDQLVDRVPRGYLIPKYFPYLVHVFLPIFIYSFCSPSISTIIAFMPQLLQKRYLAIQKYFKYLQ